MVKSKSLKRLQETRLLKAKQVITKAMNFGFRGNEGFKFKNYKSYLASKEWQEAKKYHYLFKFNQKCCCCGATDNLEVHHTSYDRLGTLFEFRDLMTLCRRCHKKVHDFRENSKRISLISATLSVLVQFGNYKNDIKKHRQSIKKIKNDNCYAKTKEYSKPKRGSEVRDRIKKMNASSSFSS